MPKVNRYNVYDNGKQILRNVPREVILKTINCPTINLSCYAEKNVKYKNRYTFEFSEEEEEEIRTGFAKEWEETVNLFKNVIWVKTGGRKLSVVK